MFYSSLIILLVIGAAFCTQENVQADQENNETNHDHDAGSQDRVAQLEKRSPHYDFGLGKRAYTYVSEYKRLPVYNFGLGKRSRPYSFGLGKRSVEDESDQDITNEIGQNNLPDLMEYDEAPEYEVKRARPYSFGLGKRDSEDDPEEKRARMYDFGLGKRPNLYSFGLGKRARNYNFGLGKRYSKFNFGLGKRQRDLHRFSFGLGKRSMELPYDDNESYFDV